MALPQQLMQQNPQLPMGNSGMGQNPMMNALSGSQFQQQPQQQGYWNRFFWGAPEAIPGGFGPIQQSATNYYNEQLLPSIAERFGQTGGALSSPAFASQLNAGSRQFAQNLAGQQSQYDLMNKLYAPQGAAADIFGNLAGGTVKALPDLIKAYQQYNSGGKSEDGSTSSGASTGADIGKEIGGSIFGLPGKVVGGLGGAALGSLITYLMMRNNQQPQQQYKPNDNYNVNAQGYPSSPYQLLNQGVR